MKALRDLRLCVLSALICWLGLPFNLKAYYVSLLFIVMSMISMCIAFFVYPIVFVCSSLFILFVGTVLFGVALFSSKS